MSRNPLPEKAAVAAPSFPTFIPSIIATAILSLALGYWVGVGHSLLPSGRSRRRRGRSSSEKHAASSSSEASSDEEIDSAQPGNEGLQDSAEECKMVFVIRTDLGMGKGKAAAQCGHATLACYKSALRNFPKRVQRWEMGGQAKVTLQVGSEDELLMLHATALSLSLTAKVIHDAGRTQIAAGSATVLGIGPAPKSLIDQVTGSLRLY